MTGRAHRNFIIAFSVVPLLGALVAIWLIIQNLVTWLDIGLLVTFYTLAALGVSTGFHRLLAHRAFKTYKPIRLALTILGSTGAEGPPLTWAAHHRKHHQCSDKDGDPHSPYISTRGQQAGILRGFWHSHLGWLTNEGLESDSMQYTPDLVRERQMRWISRHFLTIVAAGIVLPGLIALAITGSFTAFATGILWGGLVRTFLLHHFTYAVNSVGHISGRRRFKTNDQSRNVAWLAIPSFGEAWHNNHHAFPTSASHGMRWWEIDLSAIFIRTLEFFGLAWDVVRIDRERQRAKELAFLAEERETEAETRTLTETPVGTTKDS